MDLVTRTQTSQQHQARRILITRHKDLTVRFQDISSQLLISSYESPIRDYFPQPIPSLTIDLVPLLAEPAVVSRTSPKYFREARISSVHLAPEALECAVVLRGGEVALYKLLSIDTPVGTPTSLEDAELISLKHVPVDNGNRFRPQFVITAGRGPVSAFAISDVGKDQ